MGVEGYALAIVVAILLCIVLPALLRRREVLAEARIDERYSNELRMLDIRESETHEHADEPHGTIFFRQPEVIMSQSDKARNEKAPVGDVRALARDRARRKARLSKRGAHRRLGYMSGGVLGALAALGWILTAVTTIPVAVPIVASVILGVYLVGLSYVTSAMAQADESDRKAIATIDKRLGGLRRPGEGSRKAAGSREVRGKDKRSSADNGDVSQERAQVAMSRAAHAADEDTLDEVESGSAIESADEAALTIDRAAIRKEESEAAAQPQAQARDARVVTRTSAAAELRERAASMKVTAGSERRNESSVAQQRESAAAEVPSYTLKPRAFTRRTVEPYAPPEAATAAVPYRPKNVGERFDEVDSPASESTHTVDGLGGGATLEQMLNRRRA